jgi:cytochrome c oxidase subunit 1
MSKVEKNDVTITRLTSLIMVTVMVLFLVLILLGFLMRVSQGSIIQLPPDFFYAIMTLHGLGMVGALFVGGISAVSFLLSKYVKLSTGLMKLNFGLILVGVVGLVVATLLGRFGTGWYLLYPLPFLDGAWPRWTVVTVILSVMLLGVAWLLWQLDILRAIVVRYKLNGFLGWKYFSEKPEGEDVPPIVIISSVSVIVGALTTVFGALMLMLYLIQWINPDMHFDALLMKNLVFLFGHTIVNITMYFGLAIVYELLPNYTGRPWKSNKIVAIAWNAALVFVLVAYFHHLYMDMAQPVALHFIGQVASYLSTVPATVVTIFGAMAQLYKSGMKWKFAPMAMGLSLMGWLIGGFIAVVDSTIIVNNYFHNTLWVTSHFHTYFLLGFVIMLLAFIYDYFEVESEGSSKLSLYMILAGGYGIIVMFAVAGVNSVPRRYASYANIPFDSIVKSGQSTAAIASVFALVLIVGVLLVYKNILSNFKNRW